MSTDTITAEQLTAIKTYATSGSLFAMLHGATIAICLQPPTLRKYFADL